MDIVKTVNITVKGNFYEMRNKSPGRVIPGFRRRVMKSLTELRPAIIHIQVPGLGQTQAPVQVREYLNGPLAAPATLELQVHQFVPGDRVGLGCGRESRVGNAQSLGRKQTVGFDRTYRGLHLINLNREIPRDPNLLKIRGCILSPPIRVNGLKAGRKKWLACAFTGLWANHSSLLCHVSLQEEKEPVI